MANSEQETFIDRKPGESIVINGNIVIRIKWIGRNKVSLGIKAPQSVKIVREEIADKS